eukprot:631884-Pyramimonas_sp.AAC.1
MHVLLRGALDRGGGLHQPLADVLARWREGAPSDGRLPHPHSPTGSSALLPPSVIVLRLPPFFLVSPSSYVNVPLRIHPPIPPSPVICPPSHSA